MFLIKWNAVLLPCLWESVCVTDHFNLLFQSQSYLSNSAHQNWDHCTNAARENLPVKSTVYLIDVNQEYMGCKWKQMLWALFFQTGKFWSFKQLFSLEP